MLINIFGILVVAFCIGLVAVAYCSILPFEYVGNKWYRFLKWLTRNKPILFKPLIDCGKCFAGQVALWGYLFTFTRVTFVKHFPLFHVEQFTRWGQSYSIPGHVLIVFAAIYFADRLTKHYDNN